MRLALSSAAAPDLPLPDLLQACQGRGLAGLELVVDERLLASSDPVAAIAARIREAERAAGVGVLTLRVSGGDPGIGRALELARALDVPAVLSEEAPSDDELNLLRHHAASGGRVLLADGSQAGQLSRLRHLIGSMPEGSVGLGIEIDPANEDPQALLRALSSVEPELKYIRLFGGGPESIQQTGLGVGALMGRLALARFAGVLVLTPSTSRYHQVWRAWLGRGGGWGCGSKQSDDSLVVFSRASGD